ncbi:LOW QUALITY PROTEIN: double-stranded RNA-binding protein Staufen homolog 2-like [Paramacrobiotus metropolitanus]|uniref:LOW QUALITY PROTEIN: double-stranded RNA-binding protein Staufen homolog 2-like n=1 Tax=Paramacrobiotus metropolitanus TaxID=2943436 RepID=UPI002445DE9B|nr:LOW QUALITY PROTEIN: double-stranded RNA-binding protein Staufen homolog 2-like [Paramacrobiotus metropolitanus]
MECEKGPLQFVPAYPDTKPYQYQTVRGMCRFPGEQGLGNPAVSSPVSVPTTHGTQIPRLPMGLSKPYGFSDCYTANGIPSAHLPVRTQIPILRMPVISVMDRFQLPPKPPCDSGHRNGTFCVARPLNIGPCGFLTTNSAQYPPVVSFMPERIPIFPLGANLPPQNRAHFPMVRAKTSGLSATALLTQPTLPLTPEHDNPDNDTPINKLSRIARFNKVTLLYSLVDEKGPAHDKLFIAKVALTFPDGTLEFFGEGKSIKKAQHAAALRATQCPRLRAVPEKKSASGGSLKSVDAPPVARLNALAVKLRSWANYRDAQIPSPSYWQTGELLWSTTVAVCGKSFVGWGMNRIVSRNLAAQAALEYFDRQKDNREPPSGTTDTPPQVADNEKSAVTRLYEEAARRQKDVEFTYTGCDGAGHNQTHAFKCIVGLVETIGKGTSKRVAKHEAAQKMLENLEISADGCTTNSGTVERKRKTNLVKSAKAKPEYGKHINPVCRLYQVQQAHDQPNPIFEDMDETISPDNKTKEFTVSVKIPGGITVLGSGSSKKLAKRFAAENMLKALGHHLHCPLPQKSLLKTAKLSLPEQVEGDRKVTFDLQNPESEDKHNGEMYRKRFSKYPQPEYLYPKESVSEVLYEATSNLQQGRSLAPGLISLPRSRTPVSTGIPVNTISAIAKELLAHSQSSIAQELISKCSRDMDVPDELCSEPLSLLEYLCRVVNMTLSHETFSRQGPHSVYSTVLTVGEPVSSIGCGSGPNAELAIKDAAWNLLHVISEQGEVKEGEKGRRRMETVLRDVAMLKWQTPVMSDRRSWMSTVTSLGLWLCQLWLIAVIGTVRLICDFGNFISTLSV